MLVFVQHKAGKQVLGSAFALPFPLPSLTHCSNKQQKCQISSCCIAQHKTFQQCNQDSLPLLAPLGGAVPFGAPLLGDFSGELAGFGDSAGLGDSAWVLASLGLGDSDSSDLADGVFNKFSSSGRGWPSRPLSGRRVWIGRTGVSPWVSFISFSVPAFPTGPEKPLTRPSKHISKTVSKDLSKTFCYHSHWVISRNASRVWISYRTVPNRFWSKQLCRGCIAWPGLVTPSQTASGKSPTWFPSRSRLQDM